MLRPYRSFLFSAADDAPTGGGGNPPAAASLVEEFTAADPSKMTIAQRISAAGGILAKGDAHISTLTTKISDQASAIEAKDKEITELKEKLQASETRKAALEAEAKEAADAMAKVEEDAKELRSKEQDLEKRASSKANEKLGAIGFPSSQAPAVTDKPTAGDTAADLLAKFKAESDPMKKAKLNQQLKELEAKAN